MLYVVLCHCQHSSAGGRLCKDQIMIWDDRASGEEWRVGEVGRGIGRGYKRGWPNRKGAAWNGRYLSLKGIFLQ